MKKNLFKFAGLVISAMLFGACSQMATFENEDLMLKQEAAAKSGFNLTPFGTGGNENARAFPGSDDCTNPANCLEKGAAVTFTKDFDSGVLSEGNNSKRVTATVSLIIDTDNMAYYKVDYASRRTGGTSNEDVVISGTLAGEAFSKNGKWNTTNPVAGTFSTASFDYTTISCGNTFNFTFRETSKAASVNWNVDIAQLAYCPEGGCDDAFSAVTTCEEDERTAIFTFTAGDDATYKIQGGLTAFISNVLVDGATVLRETGQGNKTISWTGALEECNVKTITITWNSTNSDDEITGDWSVEKDGVKIFLLDALECNDSGAGVAPVL